MKVLRICNSENLPSYSNRDDNYIYFTYDNLNIYIGKSTQYAGLYALVETLPEIGPIDKPVEEMLYITLDGNVNTYHKDDGNWTVIGEIEDSSQLEYLEKAGTTFLLKSGHKYIDFQRKILCLPYQHGEFQLSVSLDKPIMIDNQTIIVYNPETNKFEIDGGRYYDEFGRNPEIMKYTGVITNTVNTFIQNDHIHADVRISPKVGNIIETRTDGLYVGEKRFASLDEFNDLVTRAHAEMTAYVRYMNDIQTAMQEVDITLSDQTLQDKIEDLMDERIPQIEEIVENFEEEIEHFHQLEEELTQYIDTTINNLENITMDRLDNFVNAWGYFAPRFDSNIEQIAGDSYMITVDFPVESGYGLFYKPSLIYLYPDQDISDLSFSRFNNGDVISLPYESTITIVYARISGSNILAQSCSYGKTGEEPPRVALVTVNNTTDMPVPIEDCQARWNWLDNNLLYRPGTFGVFYPNNHQIYFYVPSGTTHNMLETIPTAANYENYDYESGIRLRFYRTTDPNNPDYGYYLAGIFLDNSNRTVTGTFYGNANGWANQDMYGMDSYNARMCYLTEDICVTANQTPDPSKIIFTNG